VNDCGLPPAMSTSGGAPRTPFSHAGGGDSDKAEGGRFPAPNGPQDRAGDREQTGLVAGRWQKENGRGRLRGGIRARTDFGFDDSQGPLPVL